MDLGLDNVRFPLLDHGYVQLVESWGSDEQIIRSARMSTAKGFLGWGPKCRACGDAFDGPERDCPDHIVGRPYVDCGRGGHMFDAPGDEKLLKFLWDNQHSTPFEFAGMTIEVKAPIMVLREWMRHRTQSFSEMSARYTPLPNENYIPSIERLMVNSKTNKQAGTIKGAEELTEEWATRFRRILEDQYVNAEDLYQHALQGGVPKELARLIVPVGRYSVMRASTDLRNWCGFIKLRSAPNAQWEIRQYSNVVASLIKEAFPRTYEVAKSSLGLE